MRQKSETRATPEQFVKDIRRASRKHHSAEEKIRIALEGLRGEYSALAHESDLSRMACRQLVMRG